MTYIVEGWENGEVLNEVRIKLEECHTLLLKAAPKENGVILEAPLEKSSNSGGKKTTRKKKEKKLDFKRLPVPSKRNPYAGRVGEKANQKKRNYNVSLRNMECRPAKKPKLSKEEDVKIGHGQKCPPKTGGKMGDVDETQEKPSVKPDAVTCCSESDSHLGNEDVQKPKDRKMPEEVHDIKQQVKLESATCRPPQVLANTATRTRSHPRLRSTVTPQTTSESDAQFVKTTKGCAPKNGNFLLSKQDIKVITNGEWLTDHIIGAAQSVFRKQFPYISGMENTTLGPVVNFSVQKGEFAQILYTGSHHWILVSNIGCLCSSEVKLYDSLFRGRIQIYVKNQIASLLHEEGVALRS